MNLLTDVELEELSLVDNPANPLAKVSIFKRAEPEKEKPMTATPASFQDAYKTIAKRDGIALTAAMGRARDEYPDLLEKFQRAGEQAVEAALAAAQPVSKSAAQITFEKRVQYVRDRDGCSRTEALRTAATEFPADFDAFQRA